MAGKKNTEKQTDRKNIKEKRSFPVRFLIRLIKILFLWLPASIIVIIIIALIVLKLYLSPKRVEELAVSNFNQLSNGALSLKVNDFSPYGGFEIRDIVIRNGEEFNKTKFAQIDRLVLRYNLFSMLIGNLHIRELGIYEPRIYLKEKNGIWNAARLMKPGGEKKEGEKPEEKPSASEEIALPVSVNFLLNFKLEDLSVFVNGESFNTSVEGLTFNTGIYIPPFKRIPLSMKAVSLLETMKLELNPKGVMDVSFSNKDAGIKTPLILSWKLIFDKSGKKPLFGSEFRFGMHKAPVRFRRSYLAPLDFMISYDIIYYPQSDFLKIKDLGISFRQNRWINIAGDVMDVTGSQKFDLHMTESRISLSDLYPYFLNFTGDRSTRFGGSVSLYPLTIKGDLSSSDISGTLGLKDIYFKNPSIETSIPEINLSYDVKKRNEDMKISAGLNIRHIIAALGRDKLGDNGISLRLDINSKDNFRLIDINNFSFKVFNPATGGNALNLIVAGNADLKDFAGNIKISRFTFIKDNLSAAVKQKYLSTFPLAKPLDISLDLNFAMGDITKARLAALIRVPDYDINDLKINTDIVQDNPEQKIRINYLNIGTKTTGLSLNADGFIETKTAPFSDSDIKLVLKFERPELKPVFGPWELSGLIQVSANLKGDLKTGRAYGTFGTNDLFVNNAESMLSVEDMDLAFPFEYNFASGPVESRIAVNKTQVMENENFRETDNFTIRSIKAKHPARNMQYEYVSDFASAMFFKNNAFEISKMRMYVLDGAVYGRDILFYLADMPATGNYKNVEYRVILDVTNVDIGKLDNPDSEKKTREAELSLNANLAGKGLDMFMGKGKDRSKELNVKGFVNINKVGEEFANRLFKGLSEEKGKSKLGIIQPIVDNTVIIKGFKYNLDIGLMDVEVNLKRKMVGYLIFIEDIKRRRIPIQEYLNNIFGGK